MKYIFYHNNCVDGGMACYLFSMFRDGYEMFDVSADSGPKNFDPEGKDIVFLDVMPPDLERYKTAKKLLVIDHHQGNINRFMEKNTGKEFEGLDGISMILDTKKCAAKIVYDLNPSLFEELHPGIGEIVRLIDIQDRHVFDESNMDISRGLNALIKENPAKNFPEKCKDVCETILGGLLSFADVEKRGRNFILEIEKTSAKIIGDKRTLQITYNGHKGVYFSTKGSFESENRSAIITHILDTFKKNDSSMMFGIAVEFHPKNRVIVGAVRSRPDFNILEEMKDLGVGGHPTAGSFKLEGGYMAFNTKFGQQK